MIHSMKYSQAIDYLDLLQMHKIKLGLEPLKDFLYQAGSPHEEMKYVHVAGTNGKGSVCSALSGILRQAGYSVGMYTSPHLSDVRERFRLNDLFISKEDFAAAIVQINKILGGNRITYFECVTAVALLWFSWKKPDIILLETGMGGRLDATNVVTPLVSIITEIDLDHEQYLGNTIESIACEKAGIIKPGIPVVSGTTHPAAQKIIADYAREGNCRLEQLNEHFLVVDSGEGTWTYSRKAEGKDRKIQNLKYGISANWQRRNGAVAISGALLLQESGYPAVTEESIRAGLAGARWPGRLEYVRGDRLGKQFGGVDFLLDGAHNPSGVEALRRFLAERHSSKKKILIWGAMADKKSGAALTVLAEEIEHVILTSPSGDRAARANEIAKDLPVTLLQKCKQTDTVEKALLCGAAIAEEGDLIVVTGSLYLIGEVRKQLLGELVDG